MVGPEALHSLAGRPYLSRIGQLREAGWRIETGPEPIPGYRLTSPNRGEADPATWGIRARLGASSGLVVSEYGSGAQRLPEASWALRANDV